MSDADDGPEAVSVLFASRDPEEIRTGAPVLAGLLYPGRRFGRVLHHEPDDGPPDFWPGEWSAVAVEVFRPCSGCDHPAGECAPTTDGSCRHCGAAAGVDLRRHEHGWRSTND